MLQKAKAALGLEKQKTAKPESKVLKRKNTTLIGSSSKKLLGATTK